jgi:hypothetical protein
VKNPRNWIVLIPLLLVNSIAVFGQLEFWKSHLPWPIGGVFIFALALESIAVYLAYHASLAELSLDSAMRLRLSSYGFGLVIGILNGSHYLNHGRITAAAIGIGLMSASSPWLWQIHTRRQSRNELKSKGLIEDRAVKLGSLRWLLWPNRTFPVFRHAVWTGENSPAAAIAEWEKRKEIAEMEKELAESAQDAHTPRMTLETAASKADAVRVALAELGETLTASAIAGWLRDRGWSVTPAYVRNIRSAQARQLPAQSRAAITAVPDLPEIESPRA